jgi:hypothetical protein
LLLVKQQKWLSEFCVKIHRVASKKKFFWPNKDHPCNSFNGIRGLSGLVW